MSFTMHLEGTYIMELLSCTATQLIGLLREKRISAEELTRFYLQRIEQYDGTDGLNTVAEINEHVLQQAREIDNAPTDKKGNLFGLPLLIKDNINVSKMHTTAGSFALADNIATADAPVVANLRQSGALILGKTNMTEFANYTSQGMPNGFSSHGGQVKNAYDRKKDPGGSSTGSAVAVSAGLCAAAIGTDTSFSIVGCATENGVTGYKPQYGALSGEGIIPISHTLDSAGVLTRNVEDAILIYSAMRNIPMTNIEPIKPFSLKLAINTHNIEQVSESQMAKYNAMLGAFTDDGGHAVEKILHAHVPHQGVIMRFEFRHNLEKYLASSTSKAKTLVEIVRLYEANSDKMPYGISMLRRALDDASGALNDAEYISAMAERERLRAELALELGNYDAVLMTGGTNIMHFVGFPSIAIKLGMSDAGHPRGAILYGADERRLLSAALTLEQYCEPVMLPDLL